MMLAVQISLRKAERVRILACKSWGSPVCSSEEKYSTTKNASGKYSCCKSSHNPVRYLEILAS